MSILSCQKETHSELDMRQNHKTQDDALLVRQIETASNDVGEQGEHALKELRALPRSSLIDRLLRMRGALAPDDPLQPQIAFVFCQLDYESKANTEIVASALHKTPKYKNFFADQAASLIARLIKRGDKSLWPVLLGSVPWSDGALAEELAMAVRDELITNTETLLFALDNQPEDTRVKVYQLVHSTGGLYTEEKEKVKHSLLKVKPGAKSYRIAREVLRSTVIQ